MAEPQKSMFDEPAEKSMFDSEPVEAAPVEEETTEGLTLADQLAQGFAAPPDPYTPERSPQELSDERERADLEGMSIDIDSEIESVNTAVAPKSIFDDTANVIANAPDEISEKDIEDIKAGEYDPIMESDEKGFWEEASEYNAALVSGAFEGLDQVGNTIADIADWTAGFLTDPEDPEYFSKIQESWDFIPDDWEARDREIVESSTGKGFVNTAGQFLGFFIPTLKVMKAIQGGTQLANKTQKPIRAALQKVAKTSTGAASAGIITDFAVWDEGDKRLANFMTELGGELGAEAAQELKDNPESPEAATKFKQMISEALTHKYVKSLEFNPETDSKLMGRTKQALEGGAVGIIADLLMLSVRQFGRVKPKAKQSKLEETIATDKKNITKTKKTRKTKTTDDVFTLEAPKTKLVKAEQEEFNRAFFFDSNVKAAAEVISRNLDDTLLNSVKDLDSINNLSELIDELVENTHKAGKESWDTAKKRAGKAYQENTDALVDPDATEWEKTVANLERGLSESKNLSLSALKNGIIDQAMSRRVMKAHDAVMAKKMTEKQFEELFSNAITVLNYVSATASNIARAQQMRRQFTKEGEMSLKTIYRTVTKQGFNSTKKLLDILGNLKKDGVLPEDMLNKVSGPGWIGMGEELFRNSVLSITSLGVNITSNALMMLSRTADTHRAAFGDGAVTHKQALAHTIGYMAAIPEAFVLMVKSLGTDMPQLTAQLDPKYANEFAPNPAITSKNKAFAKSIQDPNNFFTKSIAATIDTFGKVVRGLPGSTRTMMATDEFFKTLNYRAFVMKEAVNSAEQAGINFLTNPREAVKHIKNIDDNVLDARPGDKFYGISRDSFNEAHVATFTEEFSSTAGNKFYDALKSQPGAAFLFPFVRQPVNGLKYLVRSTPGLNIISSRVERELAAGGARAELEMARLNLASAAWMAIGIDLFASEEGTRGGKDSGQKGHWNWDNRFIGAYKRDSKTFNEDRDLGIDPNTYRNENGDYVMYRGLEPTASKYSIVAGMAQEWMANMYTLGDTIEQKEYEELAESMAYTGAMVVMQSVVDQSSLRGMQSMIEYTQQPKKFWGMAAGIASPFSGLIKYQREQYLGYDLPRQDSGNTSRGTLANFEEQWVNRYGGRTVDKLNMFGDPMPRAHPQYLGELLTGKDADWGSGDSLDVALANVLSTNARKTKSAFTEPWQKELIRVKNAIPGRVAIGEVPTHIGEVKIDNKERYNLLTLFKHHSIEGQTFAQAMTEKIQSSEYKDGSDLVKSDYIKSLYQTYMEAAKIALEADASHYYRTGKHQSINRKANLLDYDRSEAFSKSKARKEARENNLRYPRGHENHIPMEEFGELYQQGDEARENAAESIFN